MFCPICESEYNPGITRCPDDDAELVERLSADNVEHDSSEARFVVLPISGRACVRALELPAAYPKDPADRIIGGTALVEGLSLLTADRAIRRSRALRTIW